MSVSTLGFFIAILTFPSALHARLSDWVDLLIGTEGSTPGSAIAGGNAFPGAALPWGMVKAGIDTSYLGLRNNTAVDCNAGYSPVGNVTAVSLLHVSGTGGVPTYGLISQMPLYGTLNDVNLADNNTYAQNRSLATEKATVGLFTTTLTSEPVPPHGVGISITASNHSAYIRYTFPNPSTARNDSFSAFAGAATELDGVPTGNDAHVLVDLTHVLPAYGPTSQSYGQRYLQGDLHVRGGAAEQVSYFGSVTYNGGWSNSNTHNLFFCSNFSIPATSSLVPSSSYVQATTQDHVNGAGTFSWQYNPYIPPSSHPKVLSYPDLRSSAGNSMGLGALFSWTPRTNHNASNSIVEAKIGVSYMSAEQACRYITTEIPNNASFESVVERAREDWETKVLNRVEILDDGSATSNNDTLRRMLYTALYHSALMPTDKTGENPYWTSNQSQPYFDDHYTLWDTYRTLLPLSHLLFTSVYSQILKGLINVFMFEGFLPAGRSANWNGKVQGGTHADIVVADAYVKSVRDVHGQVGRGELGDVDWQEAFRGIAKDANVFPERNVDSNAFDGATKEGRGALDDYLSLKFITRNHTRSISQGLEYSQNDFAIYSVAKGLGKAAHEQSHYLDRSSWWQNQWNPNANTTLNGAGTFSGFPGARDADGAYNLTNYDPIKCLPSCSWGDDIYEAKVWETAFSAAPYDMARVIALMGGDDAFEKRLDVSFVPGYGSSVGANNDAGSALFNPGNEPSFPMPFLYNYLPGRQWKTVNQSRATVDEFYSDQRNGYPGNIDAGALPSWLIFNLIGLYPVAGQAIYLVGAPRFSSLRLHMFAGTEVARSLSIKALGLTDSSFYPQSISLNGKNLTRAWISHAELVEAEELVWQMGSQPMEWDVGERPFSLSTWEDE